MNSELHMNRRSFIHGASWAALLLPILGLDVVSCGRQAVAEKSAESSLDAPWKIQMVSEKEPGEPLIISGTIFSPNGRTALPGISLYVYQTDATGHYTTAGGDNRQTRLHGLMRTNAEGRYEFRTIKPGAYPQRRNPAHVHAYVSGPGYPEYWIDEYLFADDPFVTDEMRQKFSGKGSFSSLLTLSRGSDGILRGTRDIKIEHCTNNCTGH